MEEIRGLQVEGIIGQIGKHNPSQARHDVCALLRKEL